MPCPGCGLARGHTYACQEPRRQFGWSERTAKRRKGVDPEPPSASVPTVINRHHYRGKRLPHPWLYIGRNSRDPSKASPLQNPFTVREHGDRALDLYREHLRRLVAEGDPAVLAELRKITPAHHLVCSCAPRPCHGDVVVEVWREVVGA